MLWCIYTLIRISIVSQSDEDEYRTHDVRRGLQNVTGLAP